MVNNFTEVKLQEILDIRDGTHDSPKYVDRGYPLITSKNIKDGKIDFSKVNLISKEDFDKVNKRSEVQNGDILMPMIGTIGNPVIVKTKEQFAIKNVALFKFKSNEVLDNNYLYYYLKSNYFYQQIKFIKRGGTQSFISLTDIRNLKIPYVDILLQHRIVDILKKSELLIVKRKAQIAALSSLTQSVFMEIFGDPVFTKWDKKLLCEIADIRDGTHDSPKYQEAGYPLITSKNIKNGEIDFDNVNFISEKDYIKINQRSKVEIGDIIMPMIGTIGNPIIVKDEPNFAIKNVALIKFNNSLLKNTYLMGLLSSHYLDFILQSKKRGGTQKFLSLSDIRNTDIPLPPIKLQEKYEVITKSIEKKKKILQNSLVQLECNFNSLMQQVYRK